MQNTRTCAPYYSYNTKTPKRVHHITVTTPKHQNVCTILQLQHQNTRTCAPYYSYNTKTPEHVHHITVTTPKHQNVCTILQLQHQNTRTCAPYYRYNTKTFTSTPLLIDIKQTTGETVLREDFRGFTQPSKVKCRL